MQSNPHPLQAESIRVDQAQPLPVELLLSQDQRRTSRTAPDEVAAMVEELRRIENERKPRI